MTYLELRGTDYGSEPFEHHTAALHMFSLTTKIVRRSIDSISMEEEV